MKLLFDQNLSFKLCRSISDLFPDSDQVGQLGLAQADDRLLWEYARSRAFTLVSQDADFAELATFLGAPPKLIWVRTGNQPTAVIAALLRSRADTISAFHADSAAACLELY